MALLRHRAESKQQLAMCPDFIKVRTFNDVSRGYHSICVPDLINYLERNGFYPRKEDIEAILRRVDHDANHMISYEEFCELTAVIDSTTGPESPEKSSSKSPSKQTSPVKQEKNQSHPGVTEIPAKKLELSEDDQTNLKGSASKEETLQLSPEQKKAQEQTREEVRAKIEDERKRTEAEAEVRAKAAKEADEKRKKELEEELMRRQIEAEMREKERQEQLEKLRAERELKQAEEKADRERRMAEAQASYEKRVAEEKEAREKREAEIKKEMEER